MKSAVRDAQQRFAVTPSGKGLPSGCPLSPLLGAFYLYELDVVLSSLGGGVSYIRYMDDIVIIAPTRWKLRRAIAVMNHHLEALGLEQHPDKTLIGRVSDNPEHHSGFEFLGYFIRPDGVSPSAKTLARHQDKLLRLYERCLRARDPRFGGHPKAKIDWAQVEEAIIGYIKYFQTWAKGGLKDVPFYSTACIVYRRFLAGEL